MDDFDLDDQPDSLALIFIDARNAVMDRLPNKIGLVKLQYPAMNDSTLEHWATRLENVIRGLR